MCFVKYNHKIYIVMCTSKGHQKKKRKVHNNLSGEKNITTIDVSVTMTSSGVFKFSWKGPFVSRIRRGFLSVSPKNNLVFIFSFQISSKVIDRVVVSFLVPLTKYSGSVIEGVTYERSDQGFFSTDVKSFLTDISFTDHFR